MAAKTTPLSTEEAVRLLLDSNFDTDSKECVLTLLKIIDNVLSKPTDPKVRTLRKHNQAIRRKIFDRKGGVEVLLSIGFSFVYPAVQQLGIGITVAIGTVEEAEDGSRGEVEGITLEMGKEDLDTLTFARTLLGRILIEELGVARQDVPQPKRRPATAPSTTTNSNAKLFDPFQSHTFNANAAAHGVSNPHSIRPDGSSPSDKRSETEVRLEELEEKRRKIEWDLQGRQKTLMDRGIVASLLGDNTTLHEDRGDLKGGGNLGDSSLIASQLQRKSAERKKREEGGFTTKAMRDLEKIKTAKVYSHARLRICFPDGSLLSASFLPKERISVVRETIADCLATVGFQFDIYVAPPRRKLEEGKTLAQEGLVPAAKVFVSWTGGTATDVGAVGSFLKKELFCDSVGVAKESGGVTEGASSFPQSRPVVGGGKTKSADEKTGRKEAPSREEQMMQRMLGKKGGIGGRKLGGGGGSSGAKKGKPKWFKG